MKEWQALAEANRILDGFKHGIGPVAYRQTLGEWYDAVRLPAIKVTNKSWKADLCRFNVHVRPIIGDRAVSAITPSELVRLVASLRPAPSTRRKEAHLRPSTKNRVTALLWVIFNALQVQGYRLDNPAKGLKLLPERNRRKRVLHAHEYPALSGALGQEPEWFRLLILLLLFTGMRIKEALDCRWAYVDLGARCIQIPADETKGGDVRIVPLSPPAIDICKKLAAVRKGNYLFAGKRDDSPMTRPSKRLKALFSRAGIPDFNAHDLRRTAATQASKHGANHLVSKLLGHSQTSVTEAYLAGPPPELSAMADGVGADFVRLLGMPVGEL